MTGVWGPFIPDLDPAERRARLRSLRTCVKLLVGPRGHEASFALLRCEIDGEDMVLLADALAEFSKLGTLDQRRVLASYADVQPPARRNANG